MTIGVKDLGLIDAVAMSILYSRLNSEQMKLTREQVQTLATSAYQYAVTVYEVREDFKKEYNIIENVNEQDNTMPSIMIRHIYPDFDNGAKGCEASTFQKGDATFGEDTYEAVYKENEDINFDENKKEKEVIVKNIQTKIKKEKKVKNSTKNLFDEVASTEDVIKPKRGRKPKTVLKVNRILSKKAN